MLKFTLYLGIGPEVADLKYNQVWDTAKDFTSISSITQALKLGSTPALSREAKNKSQMRIALPLPWVWLPSQLEEHGERWKDEEACLDECRGSALVGLLKESQD